MDDPVRDEVRSWLTKALRDFESARKLASEPNPYLDTAIYHCQQTAEKAVKGWLTFQGIRFEKVHDVRDLIAQAAEMEPQFGDWLETGQLLTPYATAFRYPDERLMPDRTEFEEALRRAKSFLDFICSTLPPDVRPV